MWWLKKRKNAAPRFSAPLKPDVPIMVVGDVHGCAIQLERLFQRYESLGGDAKFVTVGDYVDRGEASAKVLELLYLWSKELLDRGIFLHGNHEAMMLDALRDPVKHGQRWLSYGGLQTVASFGVAPPNTSDEQAWTAFRDALLGKLGDPLYTWLQDLPMLWRTGNVAVSHAGGDPTAPISEQSQQALVWGHEEIENTPRQDDVWMVHGHVIVDQPLMREGRINVDTGAYGTGRLTAVILRPDGTHEFVTS